MKNKKLFAILTLVCFMFTLMPVAAFAGDDAVASGTAVASVDGTEYTDLQAAIDAAGNGGTVILKSSVALTDGLEIAADDALTIDLAGCTISYASSEETGNAAITNRGSLTIKDSVGGGKITYSSSAPSAAYGYATNAITNCGTLIVNGGTIENTTAGGSSCAIDNNSTSATVSCSINGGEVVSKKVAIRQFVNSSNHIQSLTINDGEITGAYAVQSHITANITSPTVNITINGGTLTATNEDYPYAIYRWSGGASVENVTINISNGAFVGDIALGSNDAGGKVNITGGTFNEVFTWNSNDEISITGGNFTGDVYTDNENKAEISIKGGTFTLDPNGQYFGYPVEYDEYIANGYVATETDDVWTVAMEEAEEAEVTPAAPTVNTTVTDVKEEVVDAVKDALTSTSENATAPSISTDEMKAAATVVAQNNNVTVAAATEALENKGVAVAEGKTVSIVVQPYMDIQITDIEATTSGEVTVITELTLNITPKYQTVATTANVKSDEEIVTTGNNQNAVKINEGSLTITETVTVTVPLPASFVTTEQVYVKHTKVVGNRTINYMYEGTVDNNVLTFENPHGFSEFTITAATPEASIGSTSFATLQDAMNAANDNDVITINSVDTDEDVVVTVSDTKKVTLKNETEDTIIVTINNEPITIAAGKTATFSNKPSTSTSSGGGFSGSYNYPVTAGDVEGAKVTFSDNNAVAGETVTITVTPDSGKQVDEVIVTDADGDVIPVTKTGDNTYTFTMPAGKVNVAVTTEAIDYDNKIVLQIGNQNVVVDGKATRNDVAPVIQGDRTLVPIRVIVEALGGEVDWNEATRTVTITIDGKVLKLVIDEMIPGFGQGATIMDNRTYVPIRYVAEYIGANVEWIADTQQIVILK